jgi:hypothetical protein
MMRIHRLFLAAILAAAACGLLAIVAAAATFIRMDLPALARAAQLVVRVRCTGSRAQWESGSIWTFTDFEVLETFKGAAPQTLRVRLPGGRVAHLETHVEGAPRFSTGEEAVLFLEKTSAGDYGITSWAQGTFRVRRATGGEQRLTQDTSASAVFDPRTRQFIHVGTREMALNEFRRQISQALHAPQTER